MRGGEGDGVAREVFAELVPSFLTQLLRRGDLWWFGGAAKSRTRVLVPRIFSAGSSHFIRRVLLYISSVDTASVSALLRVALSALTVLALRAQNIVASRARKLEEYLRMFVIFNK